jgi:hypothetical protein
MLRVNRLLILKLGHVLQGITRPRFEPIPSFSDVSKGFSSWWQLVPREDSSCFDVEWLSVPLCFCLGIQKALTQGVLMLVLGGITTLQLIVLILASCSEFQHDSGRDVKPDKYSRIYWHCASTWRCFACFVALPQSYPVTTITPLWTLWKSVLQAMNFCVQDKPEVQLRSKAVDAAFGATGCRFWSVFWRQEGKMEEEGQIARLHDGSLQTDRMFIGVVVFCQMII